MTLKHKDNKKNAEEKPELEDKVKKISLLSKYMSMTYIPIHIIFTVIFTVFFIEASLGNSQYINTLRVYIVGIIDAAICLAASYNISKFIRKKKGKLEMKEAALKRKVIVIAVTLIVMILTAMILGAVQVAIEFNEYEVISSSN